MQAICDANMVFTDVVYKYPGSCHDSFILQNSNIYDSFQNGTYGSGVILGDSGYPLKPWLMTPISDPKTNAEIRYNKSHKKCRVTMEK